MSLWRRKSRAVGRPLVALWGALQLFEPQVNLVRAPLGLLHEPAHLLQHELAAQLRVGLEAYAELSCEFVLEEMGRLVEEAKRGPNQIDLWLKELERPPESDKRTTYSP